MRRDGVDGRHAGGERVRRLPAFDRGDVLLERQPRRVLRPRVLEALVAANLFLHVGGRLVDRRDDRAGRRIGFLAGVDADRWRSARSAGSFTVLTLSFSVAGSSGRCAARTWPAQPALLSSLTKGMSTPRGPDRWLPGSRRPALPPAPELSALDARPAAEDLGGPPLHYLRRAQAGRRRCCGSFGDLPLPHHDPEQRRHDRARRLGVGLHVAAVRADEAAAAVARPAQADPVLHLHRRRPVAADRHLLPARRRC